MQFILIGLGLVILVLVLVLRMVLFTSLIISSQCHTHAQWSLRPWLQLWYDFDATPFFPVHGSLSALRRRADGNVAAISHGQHVPTPLHSMRFNSVRFYFSSTSSESRFAVERHFGTRVVLKYTVIQKYLPFSLVTFSINQSISLIATVRPESRIANDKWYAVEIDIKKQTMCCAYMYIGAGRDV